jgi:hypothetical protein
MDHEPTQNERFREALEAYRPGGDDLGDPALAAVARQLAADPELAERFEQLQKIDAVIKAALVDVAVPDGVAQRLLVRLEEFRVEAEAAHHIAAPPAAPKPPALRRHATRWIVGLAGALAASVLVAVVLHANRTRVFSPSAALEEATRLFAVEPDAAAGYALAETPAPTDFPLSRDVLEFPQVRWRWVQGFLGGKAVAYDLSAPGGGRATLFVAQRTVRDLPNIPPLVPTPTTAGCSAAAWQQEGTLYVLVVEGGARTYRGFLDLSRGPLT